ncbi:NAD-dependent epimerase/dehydratase family protein, partial [Candidatus Bipolaricaulota bacterium]|nr:NAD-dependent epimerase/dehydratase family protein [Candidatus Bipolaricaulota bacterium]
STAMVHGDLRQDVIDENTSCAPTTVYETTKRDMECLLQDEYASQFEVAILRPTAVFGPNGKNLLKLADELSQGHRVTSYLKACLFHSRRINLVCVGNVAAATWFLANPMRSLSETIYLISDDDQENNSYGYVRNYLMKRLGIRPDTLPIVPVPSRMAQTLLRATGNVRTHPRHVYIGNNLAKEGFANPIVLEDALDEFVSWYRGAFLQ